MRTSALCKNGSKSEPVHFLQIWLLPRAKGTLPGYEQKSFRPEEKKGRLRLVMSPDGRDGSVTIQTDARLFVGTFDPAPPVYPRR